MLSNKLFQSRFGGDQSVLGKTITFNRVQYTVIGVVPDADAFIENAQVWVPLYWTPEQRAIRANHNQRGIAKLKPGVDGGAGERGSDGDLPSGSRCSIPTTNKDWGALVRPLQEDMIGEVRSSLLILLGAVALVLLIACANLANLMLVRTHGRAKEIAVRNCAWREPPARRAAAPHRGPGARHSVAASPDLPPRITASIS